MLCFSHIVISAEFSYHFEKIRSALAPVIQKCLKNSVITIDFISSDQTRSFPCGRNIVQIATDAWGLECANLVGLTFFVGAKETLTRKYRNVVPLVDQGLQGIEHIIDYTGKIICERVLTYNDIIKIPNQGLSFYKRQEAPVMMRDRAISAAAELSAMFPNIQAIFGGGFPFYLVENDDLNSLGPTPDSILEYFVEQHRYFKKKTISAMKFGETIDKKLNSEVLNQLDLFFGYNKFDIFSGTSRCEAQYVMKDYFVGSYYDDNGFDLVEDIWPCQYCTYFHDSVIFPTIKNKRGFNEECTPCKQTSLKLRNVMGCIADVDLIIVVNDNAESFASELESFMRKHLKHFVYDTRPRDTILEYMIPLDAFVVTKDALEDAFDKLGSGYTEEDIKVPALAIWLPIKSHRLELGTNFALSFELLSSPNAKWCNNLWAARRKYASTKEPKELVQRLQRGSLYHQQLLGVSWILNNVIEKLNRWKNKTELD